MTSVSSFPTSLPGSSSGDSLHRRAASTSSTPLGSSSRNRPPLESAKTVLSAELFKRRHASEFAHLHADADQLTLAAAEEALNEERRIGRVKRQSMQRTLEGYGRVNKENKENMSTWRPLSLLQQRQQNDKGLAKGHTRSKTSLNGLTTVTPLQLQRPNAAVVEPQSSASVVRPRRSLSLSDHVSGQTLEVLVEKDDSDISPPPPSSATTDTHTSSDDSYSAANTSQNRSTYSWASSFSGETAELRAAAQYVPTEVDLTSDGTLTENEILNSPSIQDQRRKRIVAIAHTVRQLEGIGSRDLEDPTFYDTLAKAWYARFEQPRKANIQAQQPRSPASPQQQRQEELTASLVAQLTSLGFQPGSPSSMDLMEEMQSPPDPEFRTPHLPQGDVSIGSPAHHAYPRPSSQSQSGSRQSRSVRYSYASTLHDLAMEGGAAQGSKLMSEKAWLRPSSYLGTPFGAPSGADYESGPPPLRPITPEEQDADSGSSNGHQYLDSPFSLEPIRNLRRRNDNIARPAISRISPALMPPSRADTAGSTSSSGFVNAWWGGTPLASSSGHNGAPRAASSSSSSRSTRNSQVSSCPSHEEDFQQGEDDTIPSRTLAPTSTPIRTSHPPSPVVLDPLNAHEPPTLSSAKIPLPDGSAPASLSDTYPPPLQHPPFPNATAATTPSNLDCDRDPSPPALLHPSYPSGGRDQSDENESLYSNLSRPNFTKTPSSTSYLPPSVSGDDQDPHRPNEQEADGSIGLAISSPPLTPMQMESQEAAVTEGQTRPVDQAQSSPLWTYQPLQAPQPPIPAYMPMGESDSPLRRHSHDMVGPPPLPHLMLRDQSISTMSLPSMTLPTRPVGTRNPVPISASSSYHASWRDTASHPAVLESDASYPHFKAISTLGESSSVPLASPPPRDASLAHPPLEPQSPATVQSPQVQADQRVSRVPARNLEVAHRSHPSLRLGEPRTLFWIGCILPFMWFVGGWVVAPQRTGPSDVTDIEKAPSAFTAGVASTVPASTVSPKVEATNRWNMRWVEHDDLWVRRCRIASAVSIPVLVLWGIIGIILVGVLA